MEASPICRGKNLTLETVMAFVNAMPKERMQKKEFHAFAESRLKGWTQTHSQIARQLALYYEENGDCIPRFCSQTTNTIVFEYLKHWASLYYVPNLYTPSLTGYNPTNIYAYLRNRIDEGESSFSKACLDLFGIPLNNTDKVRVFLNNFTDIIIEEDQMTRNMGIVEMAYPPITPQVNNIKSGKDFYYYFGDAIVSQPTKHGQHPFSNPLQQIFFGAPGTGKSHEVKKLTGEWISDDEEQNLPNVFRTTFHPDTDYASFVGCYKPTMKPTSKEEKTLTGKDEEIVYEFVPQAFTDAYIYAYTHSTEQTYLVIEEINRGNCAQIFGDLFQLLDRKGGVSEYKIKADKDLANYLIDTLGEDSEGIMDGKLCLPANLNILATMNTSDQSLFPMDSAFKRRWEWEYVPINYGTDIKSGTFEITIGKKTYPWVGFIKEVNDRIFDLTQSEDKQLGNFFIKHSVDEKEFKSKVMFYLWYEILRDETENNKYFFKKTDIDTKEELGKFFFKDLYKEDSTQTLQQFMEYLGVAPK